MSKLKPKEVYGFKCLKCFSNIYVEYFTFRQSNGSMPSNDSVTLKRSDLCKCGNCGLILDLDGIVHLYCDDINTLILCRVDTSNPSDAELLQSPKGFYYQDYKEISSTPHLFTDTKAKIKASSKKPKSRLEYCIKQKRKRTNNEKS